jgi:hypothetical protein
MQIIAEKAHALARRALSALPAIDDSVKGYEQSSWYGIAAAVRTGYEDSTGLKATPDELVAGSCHPGKPPLAIGPGSPAGGSSSAR